MVHLLVIKAIEHRTVLHVPRPLQGLNDIVVGSHRLLKLHRLPVVGVAAGGGIEGLSGAVNLGRV